MTVASLEEWIKKSLDASKDGETVAQIIEYIDWQNHTRYAEKEIEATLESLSKKGEVQRKGEKWILS